MMVEWLKELRAQLDSIRGNAESLPLEYVDLGRMIFATAKDAETLVDRLQLQVEDPGEASRDAALQTFLVSVNTHRDPNSDWYRDVSHPTFVNDVLRASHDLAAAHDPGPATPEEFWEMGCDSGGERGSTLLRQIYGES